MTGPAFPYCDRCGRQGEADHTVCAAARALEPPRYCRSCGRRLRVQVLPDAWTARCGEHGEIARAARD